MNFNTSGLLVMKMIYGLQLVMRTKFNSVLLFLPKGRGDITISALYMIVCNLDHKSFTSTFNGLF